MTPHAVVRQIYFGLLSAIAGQRGSAFLKSWESKSPAIVRQQLQVHITDGIVAARPARGRASIWPGGGPRTGNAEDVHAGPGWRCSPGELSKGVCAARMAHPAGVAHVRGVGCDAAGGHARRDK